MMGTKQTLKSGAEYDIVCMRHWHGHKAGGVTVYCKAKMARRRRKEAKAELHKVLDDRS